MPNWSQGETRPAPWAAIITMLVESVWYGVHTSQLTSTSRSCLKRKQSLIRPGRIGSWPPTAPQFEVLVRPGTRSSVIPVYGPPERVNIVGQEPKFKFRPKQLADGCPKRYRESKELKVVNSQDVVFLSKLKCGFQSNTPGMSTHLCVRGMTCRQCGKC